MSNESKLETSPLSQTITVDSKIIHVEIYRGDKGDWKLETIDESKNSLIWNNEFGTDTAALDEVKRIIEADGIDSLIG